MIIDAAFVIILILACIKGIRNGLIIAVFSIIAYIAGLAAAVKLSSLVALRIGQSVNISSRWLPFIAFLLVFIITVILVKLLAGFIRKSASALMLGWLDRMGGLLLYSILYIFIFSIFLFYATQLKIISSGATTTSVVYGYVQPLGPYVIESIARALPFLKDMFEQLKEFFSVEANKMAINYRQYFYLCNFSLLALFIPTDRRRHNLNDTGS